MIDLYAEFIADPLSTECKAKAQDPDCVDRTCCDGCPVYILWAYGRLEEINAKEFVKSIFN